MIEFERPLLRSQAAHVVTVAEIMLLRSTDGADYANLQFTDRTSGESISVELFERTIRVYSTYGIAPDVSYGTLDEFKVAYACGT